MKKINITPALSFNILPLLWSSQSSALEKKVTKGSRTIFVHSSQSVSSHRAHPQWINSCTSGSCKELWLTASTKWHMCMWGSLVTEVKTLSPILICSSLNISSTLREDPFTWKTVYLSWPPPKLKMTWCLISGQTSKKDVHTLIRQSWHAM